MSFEKQVEDVAVRLFEINAVKFGDFLTKSGIKTPIYFDLRVIVSYPEVMDTISNLLFTFAVEKSKSDHLCGVPYTALPIATLLSVKAKKSMLMRRKEAKAYGTKKMIEGHYSAGQSCLIIEDVVTSGTSVLETVNDLKQEGLEAKEAVIILDRQQGGKENLKTNGVEMKALLTMTKLLDILIKHEKITKDVGEDVKNYLAGTEAPKTAPVVDRTTLEYSKRSDLATNPVAKQLFYIMATKKTNLCLSVDLTSTTKILNLLETVGEHICLVKTHVDIIEDFHDGFITQLKNLANKYNFLILEDRKFADIGNTVSLQYQKGVYKIAEWADAVTVHSLPGEGILKALKSYSDSASKGVFLLAEMSSEGNLLSADYSAETIKMASKHSELIMGFVCQNKKTFSNPGFIQLTPGVQLEGAQDGLGQVYNTPEKIMLENGADVAVVGRGIIAAKDPAAQVVIYKEKLWQCYEKRIAAAN